MSLNSENISYLVHGCKQNNRDSQQEMYKLLYDFAYGIAYRYVNDDQDANELVNDSFLKLFRHIDLCKLDKSTNVLNSFRGWFKKIIVNTCIDHYRSNKNNNPHEADIPSAIKDNSESGEDKLGYKEIINTVKQLSSSYRTVFNLHVIEGYSHEEIAGLLDISVGTSKSNLSKAKERLRGILQSKKDYKISYDATPGQRQ